MKKIDKGNKFRKPDRELGKIKKMNPRIEKRKKYKVE